MITAMAMIGAATAGWIKYARGTVLWLSLAEHPRSAARDQGIIHTAGFYRESAALHCSLLSFSRLRTYKPKNRISQITGDILWKTRKAHQLNFPSTRSLKNQSKSFWTSTRWSQSHRRQTGSRKNISIGITLGAPIWIDLEIAAYGNADAALRIKLEIHDQPCEARIGR
jgi:hypothetical protein